MAGARVTLTARGRFDASFGLAPVPQETTTGPDGAFRFEGAASERNELVVEAAGLASARVADAKGGAQSRAIALLAGTPLSGSVKKRDGKPAAGVLLRFEADGLETRWVETGADGAFRLADLPARRGSIVADAGDDGFAEAVSIAPGPGRAPLALVLAPPTVLEGRTLDVATLKVVPRVRLSVVGGNGSDEIRVARSGMDGRYLLRGLRPGEVSVRADEPRHVLWTRAGVTLEKGATKKLDVPLTRGASLQGRVLDEDRHPVPDARVSVSSGDEGPFRFAMRALAGDSRARIRSRADGTFSASRLQPGENQRLTVRHPDYEMGTLGGVSLQAGGTRTGAVITLRRGLVVTGTVKDPEGNPIGGAELSLSQSRTVRSSRGGRLMQMSFGGFSDASAGKSGADGRFELKGVPAGEWAFTAKAPGRATEVVDPLKLVRDTRPDPLDIVLSPGAAIAGFVLRKTGGGAEGYMRPPETVGQTADGRLRAGHDADRARRRVPPRRPEGRGELRPAALRRAHIFRSRSVEEGDRRARRGRRVDRRRSRTYRGRRSRREDGAAAHVVRGLLSARSSRFRGRRRHENRAARRWPRFRGRGRAGARGGPGWPIRPRGRPSREMAGRRHGEGVPGRPRRRRRRRGGDDDGRGRDPRPARESPEGARHRREDGARRSRGARRGRRRERRAVVPGRRLLR